MSTGKDRCTDVQPHARGFTLVRGASVHRIAPVPHSPPGLLLDLRQEIVAGTGTLTLPLPRHGRQKVRHLLGERGRVPVETWLRDLYLKAPGVTDVQAARDAGYDRHPRGLVVTFQNGARIVLQAVATSRPGDDFSQPETITEADRAPDEVPVPELFDGGKLQLSAVDQHIAAMVLNSGSREVVSAEVYSEREKPGSVQYGVTFRFHDSAKIFVYVVHADPAGGELASRTNPVGRARTPLATDSHGRETRSDGRGRVGRVDWARSGWWPVRPVLR